MRSRLLILSALFCTSLSYNISPVPNLIFKSPNNESSYFGFSLNLRKSHIMIGAPRASHSNLNETGQIYRCTFDDENCEIFKMDNEGHSNEALRSNQLLGFSMDGHESENDKFVACAPKFAINGTTDYFMLGKCFYTENTVNNFGNQTLKIEPLYSPKKDKYLVDRIELGIKSSYIEKYLPVYALGESGFSVHIPDTKNEVLTGCPGILLWIGSISRFNFKTKSNEVGDVTIWGRNQNEYLSEHSYFGFAVTSGKFFLPTNSKLIYVASAPNRNNFVDKAKTIANNGIVMFFEMTHKLDSNNVSRAYNFIHHQLRGTQIGSAFGYALLCDDFNNDGMPDLVVSAPFYAKKESFNNGAVYVFLNQGSSSMKLKFKSLPTLTATSSKGGEKFGMALGKIGDINGDGFNDLAISSVHDDLGVICIYHGGVNGVTLSQTIQVSAENSMFGFSISRGVDIDGNFYPDIAVGDPKSDTVYIFKTYPIVNVLATLSSSKKQIELIDEINITACIQIMPKKPLNFDIEFKVKLIMDPRTSLKNSTETTLNYKRNISESNSSCEVFPLTVSVSVLEKSKPILFRMEYEVPKKIPKLEKDFCEDCVLLNKTTNHIVKLKLPVDTGCKNESCKPDLKIIGSLNETIEGFVIGKVKNATIIFNISNSGEPAYFSRLSIVIPDPVKFSVIPSSCEKIANVDPKISCRNKSEMPLKKNDNFSFVINLEVSEVRKNLIEILAVVSSGGDEVNKNDNNVSVIINFEEKSNIVAESQPDELHMDILKDDLENQDIKYVYKILNDGPSPVNNFSFDISFPKNLIAKNEKLEIIKLKSIKAFYKNDIYEIGWKLIDQIEIANISDSQNGTILDCDQSFVECIKAETFIQNFDASQVQSIDVIVNFLLIKKTFDKFLNSTRNKIIWQPKFHSQNSTSIKVEVVDFSLIIKKVIDEKAPLWILIASIVGGLIFLLLMILTLAKLGFFKRKIKAELVKIKRETLLFPLAATIDANQSFLPNE